MNRLTKVTYPDNTYEQIAYNLLDVASTRDRDGRVTHYTHDAARRLTGIEDPAGRLTALAWCNCGALSALTDAAGHTTNWTYDFMSRLTGKTYPDNSKVSYTYQNTISRLASITDALSQQTLFTYNESNQLTGVSYQNAVNATPGVTFSYEPLLGRLNSMTDGTGLTSFLYNTVAPGPGAGRLAQVRGPIANSPVQYGYDASGRVISVGVNGTAESYTYNPYGQLSGVTNPLGSFTYGYDSAGRLNLVDLPNGAKTALSYYPSSQSGRLEDITHNSPAMALLAQYGYGYDPAGQITSWTQQQGSGPVKTLEPGYDLAGQLTGTTQTFGSLSPTALSWAYDQAGNRTESTFNGIPTAYTANNLNQLTQVAPTKIQVAGVLNVSATVTVNGVSTTTRTNNGFNVWVPGSLGTQVLTITAQNGGVNAPLSQQYQVANGKTLQYDADGELINDGRFAYSWDAANRLVQITQLNPGSGHQGHTSQFSYDGLWRRVENKELDGVDLVADRKFIWDDDHIVEERDQHNNVVKRFCGGGVQVVSGMAAGNYYYLRDHLGSIKNVLDASGNVVSVVDYDLWGNLSQTAGTFTPDFGYAGMFEHQPSGLVLTWFRAYMPLTGRWISRDPYGERGGANLYGYVFNQTTVFVDPYGLWSAQNISKGLCALSGVAVNVAVTASTGGFIASALGDAFSYSIGRAAIAGGVGALVALETGSQMKGGAMNGAVSGALAGGAGNASMTGALIKGAAGALRDNSNASTVPGKVAIAGEAGALAGGVSALWGGIGAASALPYLISGGLGAAAGAATTAGCNAAAGN